MQFRTSHKNFVFKGKLQVDTRPMWSYKNGDEKLYYEPEPQAVN